MSHSDPCPVCGRRLAGATIEASDGTVMCASHAADLLEAQSIAPPPTRGDCASIPRPCMRTRCRYNLASTREGTWSTRACAPGCALDPIDEQPGGRTLEEVADLFGVTRERVRQIESIALRRVRRWCRIHEVRFEDLFNPVGTYQGGGWVELWSETPAERKAAQVARSRASRARRVA